MLWLIAKFFGWSQLLHFMQDLPTKEPVAEIDRSTEVRSMQAVSVETKARDPP